MQSGHYISYLLAEETWYEADDSKLSRLAAPPTAFPYLVFLTKESTAARGKRTRDCVEEEEVAQRLGKGCPDASRM